MAYVKPKSEEEQRKLFGELCAKPIEDQQEFFLKSFIFALGDNWKEVPRLGSVFRKYIHEAGEGKNDFNEVQASDFLQKNGFTRTAIQRKNELNDIDLDNNKRIAFLEYLLLHFKFMILHEYFKRLEKQPTMKLTTENDVVGLTGVGLQLLDELFTLPTQLPPELVEALEKFTATIRTRENRTKELREKAAQGGVKGMAAQNEMIQMEKEDTTDLNRLELTLNAAKKKAQKTPSSEQALQEKLKKQEEEEKQKKLDSQKRLKEKASLWNK
jgi:hypothetical protein